MELFVIGVICGIIASKIFQRFRKTIGTLIVDMSDPDKDIYRLEIDNLDNIPKMKYILLKVETSKEIAQY